MCVKLGNLQACRIIVGNFTNKRTPSQVFFDSILSPPHALPIHWLNPPSQILTSPPPMFSIPVGNPGQGGGMGEGVMIWTWGRVLPEDKCEKFFLKMNFQVIWTSQIARFTRTIVTFTALKENWEKFLEKAKG